MMVKLDVIMTRGGDGGETSLGDGARVRKDALRVEAYGTVDEANAALGVLRLHLSEDAEADSMVARIQNDLFDLGADLCVPGTGEGRLRITDSQCARLEAEQHADGGLAGEHLAATAEALRDAATFTHFLYR
jgi:cob(I)alamin adenosyltransferase